MTERENITLTELIYDKEKTESVDFELAFTAFLATAGLASLSGPSSFQIILKITFVSLILLTMIRRMATSSRYTDRSAILAKTMRPIELLSILAFFQLFVAISSFIIRALHLDADLLPLMGLIFPSSILLLVILQELLFKNYMILWATLFYGKAVSSKKLKENASNPAVEFIGYVFANFWAEITYITLTRSLANSLPEALEEIDEFYKDITDKIEQGETNHPSRLGFFLISGLVFIPLLLGISYVISFIFGSFGTAFILVVSIWGVKHIVGFWYIAHGTETVDRLLQRSFSTVLIYAIVVYFVFSLRFTAFQVPFL